MGPRGGPCWCLGGEVIGRLRCGSEGDTEAVESKAAEESSFDDGFHVNCWRHEKAAPGEGPLVSFDGFDVSSESVIEALEQSEGDHGCDGVVEDGGSHVIGS